MFEFISQPNLIIQGCLAAILLGVFYNIWSTTKVYGGIIGTAIRLLAIGMLFVTIALLERVLINFNIIAPSPFLAIAQDVMNLIALIFLGLGFSKLGSARQA